MNLEHHSLSYFHLRYISCFLSVLICVTFAGSIVGHPLFTKDDSIEL